MPKLTPLCKIAVKYGTDKCPQINHTYTSFYYELLKDKRYSIKKVLEMGIGDSTHIKEFIPHYVAGASLLMWRDFFPNAQIYGANNDPKTLFTAERIKTFLCDETKEEDIEKLIEQTGSDIDLFIDDGAHGTRNQFFLCCTLLPLLNKDVIYIIEDVRLPRTLHRWFSRLGYSCYIPQLPPTLHRKRVLDNIIFIVKPKQ